MRYIDLYIYYIIRYTILFITLIAILLGFIVEKPALVLKLASKPLAEYGIKYRTIKGGLISGFKLEGLNYQDKIIASSAELKVNWNSLRDGKLLIDNLNLNRVHISKSYLKSLIDSNSSSDDDNISLPFNRIVVKKAHINIENIIYDDYKINSADLDIKNFKTDMKSEYIGDIKLKLDSNIANLNLIGNITKSNNFKLKGYIEPKREFLKPFLKEQNITLKREPKFYIDIDGDLERLKYYISVNRLGIDYLKYNINSKKLILNGNYNIEKSDIYINIDTILNSDIAKLKLKGDSSFNLNNINRSLEFNLKSNITPIKKFIEDYIKIKKIATINLNANGTLKKTNFKINLKDFRAEREDIDFRVSSLFLNGYTKPLNGDTQIDIKGELLSNIVDGVIKDRLKFNFNDINRTLNIRGDTKLLFKSKYLNGVIQDKNITILNNPKADISIDGNLKRLTLKIGSRIDVLRDKLLLHLKLDTSPIKLSIINHNINGGATIINNSKDINFSIKSRFSGDYTNLKLIDSNSTILIKRFNAFGVNLNPLTPLNLTINSSKKGAFAKLNSKRVKLNIATKDYDNIKFNINTRKLYLYKIVELPHELHHKFIELHLRGDVRVSKNYFNINGNIYSNKKFKATINAQNSLKGLKAYLDIPHLKLNAYGNIDKKDIKLNFTTESILGLQKEIKKLYPFNIAKVDGSFDIKAKLRGEKVWLSIISPKIEFNGFNIENIDIDGNYKKSVITFNRIDLKTTGFEDKKFNKKIHLNRKAKIYLREDKRDILIDMLPNILIIAKGNKKSLRGKLFIKNLPIGHPDYGTLFLNTNISYRQNGNKKSITGNIYSKKMRLFYEAKFLDIAYDPDVIVVTKKSKKIKKRLNDNSFLNDTYINLNLKAPKAEYRTPDIYLNFDVNLNINKPFGEPLSLIGKIKDINGHYDQVSKRFKIVNSTILFKGEEKINPLLDIRVEYELPQVMIYIDIGGDASHPKIEFSSEPPMPKKDIMSYLLLGVSTAKLTSGNGSLGREAELFILNQAARDFAYDFNLDRLFIKDDGTGDGYIIEAGKKITKHNMLIIESSKEGNSYILEHEFDKTIKLRVGQHQKEHPSESIDIFYRTKFK